MMSEKNNIGKLIEEGKIMLVDKPAGMTSFDVIRKMRKKLGIRKIGHAGTLDPLATGLLILGIGEGTKELKNLIDLDKEYEFKTILGLKTETGDLEGKVIEEKKVDLIDKNKIKAVLKSMMGDIELPVPKYSAIKVGGEPLYKKARRGENVDNPVKKMGIRKLKLLNIFTENSRCVLFLKTEVTKGTYIRAISEEIGRRLGLPATTKDIRRTKVGIFGIDESEKI